MIMGTRKMSSFRRSFASSFESMCTSCKMPLSTGEALSVTPPSWIAAFSSMVDAIVICCYGSAKKRVQIKLCNSWDTKTQSLNSVKSYCLTFWVKRSSLLVCKLQSAYQHLALSICPVGWLISRWSCTYQADDLMLLKIGQSMQWNNGNRGSFYRQNSGCLIYEVLFHSLTRFRKP